MLNHADYVITALMFPYESEDPWAIKVKYKNKKNGKSSDGMFNGKDGWMKVSEQCRKQIATADYVTVTHEPKPKRVVAKAPVQPLKGKGKKKG